jgi:Sulfotransferase family
MNQFFTYSPLPVNTRGRGRLQDALTMGAELIALANDYVRSWPLSAQNRTAFQSVARQCLFIGCPKTGHSLIGSLLDAHPNIILAHELGVSKYVLAGFRREQLYNLMLENSQYLADLGHRELKYDYRVPGQWQGKFERLLVIGDKHAEGETLRVMARPWLFEKTRRVLGQVKFIHVIRNPYDVIASLTKPVLRHLDLRSAADYFFRLCQTTQWFREQLNPEELYELRHEAFVAEPARYLAELCNFLEVPAEANYLQACAAIVFESPHQTRRKVTWTADLIDSIQSRLPQYSFLSGYDFES